MAKGELIDPVAPAPVKQVKTPAYTDKYLKENAELQKKRDYYNSSAYRKEWERRNPGKYYRPEFDIHRMNLFSKYNDQLMTKNAANSNMRRGLLGAIESAPANLREEQRLLHNEAGDALTRGLKNTRENFNSRGMLYSGLRQSGEQSLRGEMASTLASQQASAARDNEKMLNANKQQLATIGLRSGKEAAARAEATFEAKMRADIARRQALQQLGEGVGYGVGAFYGKSSLEPGAEPERRRFYGTSQYLSPGEY